MSDIAIIQKATLYEMADAIIDTTERTESFKVSDMPKLIREDVYNKGYADGEADLSAVVDEEAEYQASIIAEIKEAANKLPDSSEGGSGECERFDYIAYWDEMLGEWYTEVQGGYIENPEDEDYIMHIPTSVLVRSGGNNRVMIIPPEGKAVSTGNSWDLIVIPRSITNIVEAAFDEGYNVDTGEGCVVVCLAPTPPALGWQGAWSCDGGCMPPTAIYVPDASVNAYKADTTWAEYADRIVPISTFEYFVTEG